MSDNTLQNEKGEDSEVAVDEPMEEDVDADLENALFGEDDGSGEPTQEEEQAAEAGMAADEAAASEEPVDLAKQQAADRNQLVMDLMTEEQLERYEAFRRSGLNKNNVKRVLQTIAGQNISPNIVLVMRGLAKVFVGELVETAQLIAHELGDSGPLQPSHYAAAYQQLDQQGKVLRRGASKKLRL